eukprot:CAMPEP_0169090456 /NCGR_PEP_ID=MMETSP1015-20121227/15828_1 /TAXON_ID=342587 /ORGANISM="Karlodinium micrum, Strain CCMP2283" /LENGTH=127 /DNA_ID=CAMNT_0009150861 /DNA_START=145 /DNA_END=528 /DNA_ORIENTATION=-
MTIKLLLDSKDTKGKGAQYVQWMLFWVICIVYSFLDSTIAAYILPLDSIPLYQEVKCLTFLWLSHPHYWGAAFLWQWKLKALHEPLDEHYEKILKVIESKKEEKKDEKKEGKTTEATNEDNTATKDE